MFSRVGGDAFRFAIGVALALVFIQARADEDKPNCDPRVGLVDGSCYHEPSERELPWWTCERYMYRKPEPTKRQLQLLKEFGSGIFSPGFYVDGFPGPRFSRDEVAKRFGRPLGTKSKEVPRDPQDPYDKGKWEMTTWDYPGFRITTGAEMTARDKLWLENGEVFGPNVRLLHEVRVGQSIERWAARFGQPDCSTEGPQGTERYFVYAGETDKAMYEVHLFADRSGKVKRIKWFHPEGH